MMELIILYVLSVIFNFYIARVTLRKEYRRKGSLYKNDIGLSIFLCFIPFIGTMFVLVNLFNELGHSRSFWLKLIGIKDEDKDDKERKD